MFLVVVSLPLIDRDHKFEIYNIINSQLPYHDPKIENNLQPKFSAKYKIETSALAITVQKTQYMILNNDHSLQHTSFGLL